VADDPGSVGPLYLSSLLIDPREHCAARALIDSQAMSALVATGLGPARRRSDARMLHTVDALRLRVFVQSAVRPDWGRLPPGVTLVGVRDVASFLCALADGDAVRFKLTAAPSAVVTDQRAHSKQRVPLVDDASRLSWFERKLAQAAHPEQVTVLNVHKSVGGRSPGSRVVHTQVTFIGALKVLNAARLRTLIVDGVGAAKAYGNGLLLLSR
jgi:CRISPR system Cascade subunit CasE